MMGPWAYQTTASEESTPEPHGLPSGIVTKMLSTPLFTVRGRVCSVGDDAQSSCRDMGWYCMIIYGHRGGTNRTTGHRGRAAGRATLELNLWIPLTTGDLLWGYAG